MAVVFDELVRIAKLNKKPSVLRSVYYGDSYIGVTNRHVALVIQGTEVSKVHATSIDTGLNESTYPDLLRVYPETWSNRFDLQLNKGSIDILKSIKMKNMPNHEVPRLTLGNAIAKINDIEFASYTGPDYPIQVSLNSDYLSAAMAFFNKTLKSETVTLRFNDAVSPFEFSLHINDLDYRYLITPIRTY